MTMFEYVVVSVFHSFFRLFVYLFIDFAQTLFSCKYKYQILTPATINPRESLLITDSMSIRDFNPRCLFMSQILDLNHSSRFQGEYATCLQHICDMSCRDDRTRTYNLMLPKHPFYQLNYIPILYTLSLFHSF